MYLATGVRLSGFLLLGYLFPGFPSFVSPSASMVSRFPRASLHWSLCLLVSQPGFGRQVVSVSPDVSLHLNGFPAMASGLSILGGVVWLSGCLSLRVFLHVSPILASGVRCPDVFSLLSLGCHHFSLPFVSRFICLPTHVSSVISLPYSGGV